MCTLLTGYSTENVVLWSTVHGSTSGTLLWTGAVPLRTGPVVPASGSITWVDAPRSPSRPLDGVVGALPFVPRALPPPLTTVVLRDRGLDLGVDTDSSVYRRETRSRDGRHFPLNTRKEVSRRHSQSSRLSIHSGTVCAHTRTPTYVYTHTHALDCVSDRTPYVSTLVTTSKYIKGSRTNNSRMTHEPPRGP